MGHIASDRSVVKACNFEPAPTFMCNVVHVRLMMHCTTILQMQCNGLSLWRCVKLALKEDWKRFGFCMLNYDGTVPSRLFCFAAVMLAHSDGVVVIQTHEQFHHVLQDTMQQLYGKFITCGDDCIVFKVLDPFFTATRSGDVSEQLWPSWTFILD